MSKFSGGATAKKVTLKNSPKEDVPNCFYRQAPGLTFIQSGNAPWIFWQKITVKTTCWWGLYLDLPFVCKICAEIHPKKPSISGRNFTYLEDPGISAVFFITFSGCRKNSPRNLEKNPSDPDLGPKQKLDLPKNDFSTQTFPKFHRDRFGIPRKWCKFFDGRGFSPKCQKYQL